MAIDAPDPTALLAIVAMAAVTGFLRTGGYWLMGRLPVTARVQRMLEAMPGSILVAVALPLLVKGGLPALIAIIAVFAAMFIRRSDLVGLIAGLVAAALARAAGL